MTTAIIIIIITLAYFFAWFLCRIAAQGDKRVERPKVFPTESSIQPWPNEKEQDQ